MRSHANRHGWLLVEVLVAMVVGVVLLGALAGLVRGAMGGGGIIASRAEALDVVRTVWVVLEEELGAGVPGRDWHLDLDGSIALRAFRGFGRVCGVEDGVLSVAYRGQRQPDPGRDSLLVLEADGSWTASSFDGFRPAGICVLEGDERELGLADLSFDLGSAVLVRVFERGSYHLADGAFRYRRGGGGRQPLTPERIAESSRFELAEGGVVARIAVEPRSGIGPFTWLLPVGWP